MPLHAGIVCTCIYMYIDQCLSRELSVSLACRCDWLFSKLLIISSTQKRKCNVFGKPKFSIKLVNIIIGSLPIVLHQVVETLPGSVYREPHFR